LQHGQDWLFRHGPLRPLAVCRIGWALAMLFATWHESGLAQLYSRAQYHVPLCSLAAPLEANTFRCVIGVAAVGGVLGLLGCFTRVGIVMLLAALGYLFALDLLLFRNHVYLGLLMGALLACSPAGHALSLDAWRQRRWSKPLASTGSLACAQLIKAQVLIVYGYSAINKLRWPFLDGFVLEQELPFALRSCPLRWLLCNAQGALHPAVNGFLHSPLALSASSLAIVCAETFLALGLPRRKLRPYALTVGLSLHLGIYLLMGIHVFGLLMVCTYPLFAVADNTR
jgi:hypothetical protein